VEACARVEAEKENYRREKFWNRDHRDRLEGEVAELKRWVRVSGGKGAPA